MINKSNPTVFKPGHPKLGGRKKGTRNKNEIRDILEQNKINLIVEFIDNLKAYPHNPIAQNTHILKLMEYVYPKCRSDEGDISPLEALEILRNDLRERGAVIPDGGTANLLNSGENISDTPDGSKP